MARRGDHSREEIHQMALDAAEALVCAEGHDGLSARKVAAAIGYTVGTLYLVFKNLDDLILQVNGRSLDKLYEQLRAVEPQDAPKRALIPLAHAYIRFAETEPARWDMLFDYAAKKGDVQPEWYRYKLGKVFGLVEAVLRPLTPDEAETQRIARVLWAGVHGICTLKTRQRMNLAGGQSAEEMASTLIENFLRGFCS